MGTLPAVTSAPETTASVNAVTSAETTASGDAACSMDRRWSMQFKNVRDVVSDVLGSHEAAVDLSSPSPKRRRISKIIAAYPKPDPPDPPVLNNDHGDLIWTDNLVLAYQFVVSNSQIGIRGLA